MKPFSQACENNKRPILEVLKQHFASVRSVLEIGSGTGQHAVHFAAHLPHLQWQTSDLVENHAGIRAWLAEANLPNLAKPLTINVAQPDWPIAAVEGIFTANTLHIMSWREVEWFFAHLPEYLQSHGLLAIYGPFNYGGEYTSDSNRQFDAWLKTQAAHRAIRDFEAVNELAEAAGLRFIEDHIMPANNRLLVWKKRNSVN